MVKVLNQYVVRTTGDLMCKVVLETPINLSGDQADLLRQLEEKMGKSSKKHSPKETGFFDGVKKFFDDSKKLKPNN